MYECKEMEFLFNIRVITIIMLNDMYKIILKSEVFYSLQFKMVSVMV